ncbi:UNKNOWN [Stylonychia lemnae]|uniref:Uncharacterized protein n=1 Tax=Stylonychia lemnae TaxID=5949 RepID=A0A078ASM7_STYLE|nr:UNKNOWN [Stylonychia lemnae]|eukprot:CDW85485.1 UNKNOWN [Stylonychia lemnae]
MLGRTVRRPMTITILPHGSRMLFKRFLREESNKDEQTRESRERTTIDRDQFSNSLTLEGSHFGVPKQQYSDYDTSTHMGSRLSHLYYGNFQDNKANNQKKYKDQSTNMRRRMDQHLAQQLTISLVMPICQSQALNPIKGVKQIQLECQTLDLKINHSTCIVASNDPNAIKDMKRTQLIDQSTFSQQFQIQNVPPIMSAFVPSSIPDLSPVRRKKSVNKKLVPIDLNSYDVIRSQSQLTIPNKYTNNDRTIVNHYATQDSKPYLQGLSQINENKSLDQIDNMAQIEDIINSTFSRKNNVIYRKQSYLTKIRRDKLIYSRLLDSTVT